MTEVKSSQTEQGLENCVRHVGDLIVRQVDLTQLVQFRKRIPKIENIIFNVK